MADLCRRCNRERPADGQCPESTSWHPHPWLSRGVDAAPPPAKPQPSDTVYEDLIAEAGSASRLAGQMLTMAHFGGADPGVCRQLAEEYAKEAAEAQRKMMEWRLANGYDR